MSGPEQCLEFPEIVHGGAEVDGTILIYCVRVQLCQHPGPLSAFRVPNPACGRGILLRRFSEIPQFVNDVLTEFAVLPLKESIIFRMRLILAEDVFAYSVLKRAGKVIIFAPVQNVIPLRTICDTERMIPVGEEPRFNLRGCEQENDRRKKIRKE